MKQGTRSSAARLSVIILTYNEETNLPACLASLDGLDGNLLVVDSGSTDRTVEIAAAAGATVKVHPFEHYATQRNWAQQQIPQDTEWVLHLDADERLTPELVAEITTLLQDPPQHIAGYLLRKRTVFMGRWIKHRGHYPSYHLRLFRNGYGQCEERLYDQHFLVDGQVGTLRRDYIDVVTADLDTWTLRHLRWAGLEACEALANGQEGIRVQSTPFGDPIAHRRWLRDELYTRLPLFARAFLYWGYRYIVRLGFLDGKEGLIFHFLQGCWYRFLVDVRLDEARKRLAGSSTRREIHLREKA